MNGKINNNYSPLLSVITVVYNNKTTLEDTILSVVNQTFKDFEYIIIDGGSTDGTIDIIKKYEKYLTWVSEPDQGIYDAMNKGIKAAQGRWIHILNSDDRYCDRHALERVASYLKDESQNFYSFTMWQQYPKHQVKYNFKYNFYKLFYSAYLPHPTMVAARSQYERVGLYSTSWKFASDHDMILRLCENFTPKVVDLPLAVMTMGGVSGRNVEQAFAEFRDVTVKHGLPAWVAEIIFIFKKFKFRFSKKLI